MDNCLQVHSDVPLQILAHWLSQVGEWWVIGPVGALVAAICLFLRRPQAVRAVAAVTLVGLGSGLTSTILRFLIGRTRPNALTPQGFYGVWHNAHWIGGRYEFASFPSGHTATVAGLAAAAWLVNRQAGVWTGAFAALVAWSRIAQSCHHFSDIVASVALGIWAARVGYARLERALPPRTGGPAKSSG